jgi:hypothetical protein
MPMSDSSTFQMEGEVLFALRSGDRTGRTRGSWRERAVLERFARFMRSSLSNLFVYEGTLVNFNPVVKRFFDGDRSIPDSRPIRCRIR